MSLDYSHKIRTIQQAIKTQNDVLINKINTIINQCTLDAFQTLDTNLDQFLKSHHQMNKENQFSQHGLQQIQEKWIKDQMQIYQEFNLKNVYEQLSSSINHIQNPNSEASSSLTEVLQLFIRAAELYSKNLKELLNFQQPPNPNSANQAISSFLNQQNEDRQAQITEPKIVKVEDHKLGINAIYDIHPMKNTNQALISTFENDLLIYDFKNHEIVKQLDPLPFAPTSMIFLHELVNNKIERSQQMILGGSEFDPNVYVYNYHTGRRIQTLPGHDRSVRFLVQLGDMTTLVSAGRDTRIFFWNLLKGEPLQIQQIPTMEIIDLQFDASKNQINCLSIDGKISIFKVQYQSESDEGMIHKFEKADLIQILELHETSSLSQMVWFQQKLLVISFESGWLTGQDQVKVLEEKKNQTGVKFIKDKVYKLTDELQQLNTVLMDKQIYVFGVYKKSGLVVGFEYPVMKQIRLGVQEENKESQIRWNIKLINIDGKQYMCKFGKDDKYELYQLE